MSGRCKIGLLRGGGNKHGHRHDSREPTVPIRRLASHIRHHERDECAEPPCAVRGAGAANVAEGQRTRRGGGQGGQVAGPEVHRFFCSRHRHHRGQFHVASDRSRHLRPGTTRVVVVVDVALAADRMETHADHNTILHARAGNRNVRVDTVLHGRGPILPAVVRRRHRVTVPVRRPHLRRRRVLESARVQAQTAGRHLQRNHGRVADHHHRFHACVRKRSGTADCGQHGHGCSVYYFHIRLLVGSLSGCLDTLQRGVSHARQRSV